MTPTSARGPSYVVVLVTVMALDISARRRPQAGRPQPREPRQAALPVVDPDEDELLLPEVPLDLAPELVSDFAASDLPLPDFSDDPLVSDLPAPTDSLVVLPSLGFASFAFAAASRLSLR